MNNLDVTAILKASVGNFTRGMKEAENATKNFKKNTESNVSGAQKALNGLNETGVNLSKIGMGLTKGITLPLVAMSAIAVKTGAEFEQQMSRVQAISGATGDQFKQLEAVALDLGASTAFSASEVAEGMENMASAGFKVEDIISAMPGILDLAAVSGGDVALASDAAATAINQFGLEASQAGHVADVFARAAADTNAETVDMAEALKYAGPMANTLGVSLEETAAAIGIMSDAGIKGSQAGTTLRGALTRLAKPTKQSRELMEELGISFFDANGEMKPFEDIVSILQGSMKGLTKEQQANAMATIFGQEAMSGMLALVDAGPEKFNELEESLVNSTGAADEMAKIMQDNLLGSWEEFTGAIETASINISKILGPALRKVIDYFTELVNKFNQMTPEQQSNVVQWLAIAAAIGPVLLILGKVFTVIATVVGAFMKVGKAVKVAVGVFKLGGTAFGALKAGMLALSGPVGWITALIVALVAGGVLLWKNWDKVKAKAAELGTKLKEVWGDIKQWSADTWNSMKESASAAWEATKSLASSTWNSIKDFFVNTFNSLKEWGASTWQSMKDTAVNTWNTVKDFFSQLWTSIKDTAVSSWTATKDFFTNLWTSLRDGAISIWQNITTAIMEKFNQAKEFLFTTGNAIRDTLVNVWNVIFGRVTTIVANIVTSLLNTFGPLVGSMQNIFGLVRDTLVSVWNNIKVIAGAAWEIIKNVIIGPILVLLQMLKGDWEGARDSLSQIWENIKVAAQTIWTALKDSIITIVQNLLQMAVQLFTGIKDSIINVWNILVERVVYLANQIWDRLVTIFTNVKTTLVDLWNTIKDSVVNTAKALKDGVVNWFIQTKNNVITAAKNIKTGVVNWFNQTKTNAINAALALKNGVINWFNTTKTNAINAVKNLKTQVTNWFNQTKTSAINAIRTMKTNVVNWFNNTKTSAVNSANNLKNSVVNSFRTLISNVGTWISQLPAKVGTAFRNAITKARSFGSQAISAGKNLISGFINGVKNKAKALVDSVGSAITGAIDKAKSLLGIKSPSRVFKQFGVYTDQGFIEGIKGHSSKVVGSVSTMMDDVKNVWGLGEFDFASDIDRMTAKATSKVDHTISDNLQQPQKQEFTLVLGGRSYRAFVNSITEEQDKQIILEEVFA